MKGGREQLNASFRSQVDQDLAAILIASAIKCGNATIQLESNMGHNGTIIVEVQYSLFDHVIYSVAEVHYWSKSHA